MKKKKTKKKTKKVKKDVNHRVSTGVKKLDKLLSGGLKRNSITLVAGGAGSGKSIFAMQFLMDGLEKNQSCMFITFEEKKKKFYEDMLQFGWDLEKYEKKKIFYFLEYTPEQVKSILTQGGGIVESIIEEHKVSRMVIDSITSFSLLYEDELTKKEAGLSLFELIGKWDCTAVLTSQDESRDGKTVSAAMEFEVDGIILLYHMKLKGVRDRALEILKMRGTKIPEKTMGFDITSKGIVLHPKEIIKY